MLHLPDYFDWTLELNIQLVSRVVKEVPRDAEAALTTALSEGAATEGIFFTRKLRDSWTPRLTEIALAAVEHLPGLAARDVLASLLVSGRREAISFAIEHVNVPVADNPVARVLAVAGAQALLATGTDQEFAAVWPLITSDPAIGNEVLGTDSPHSESSRLPLVARLREPQLADLYVWLVANRPRVPATSTGLVGPSERLESLERHALSQLQTVGTPAAILAIERIRAELPEARWLLAVQDDAERALRTNPGQRPTAAEILHMVEDRTKRFLASETDLLDAILDSLNRLQSELTGDNPIVRFLWNRDPLKPRDEIDVSIFVANYLRRDLASRGVVLNREVNISTISETDIRVEALAPDTASRSLVVTIEVKGSWHPELLTAMETQLRDRYLSGSGTVGLYLVGWFRTDGIEDRGPTMTMEEISERLRGQASALSSDRLLLKSYVLDCCWREELPRPKTTKKVRSRPARSATP